MSKQQAKANKPTGKPAGRPQPAQDEEAGQEAAEAQEAGESIEEAEEAAEEEAPRPTSLGTAALGFWRRNYFIPGYGNVSGRVTPEALKAFKGQLNPDADLDKFIAATDILKAETDRLKQTNRPR
jgi:hypothetical protein